MVRVTLSCLKYLYMWNIYIKNFIHIFPFQLVDFEKLTSNSTIMKLFSQYTDKLISFLNMNIFIHPLETLIKKDIQMEGNITKKTSVIYYRIGSGQLLK